ncbi:MAG: DNA polymerase domain-containing protein [Victivallales bacterium]
MRSLYPSIILSEQWTPGRDSLGVFPRLLERLRTFRLNAKDSAKNAKTSEEKDYYSALQSTFKILINSFYGYLGFEQGFLNDYDMAERVTTRGREILTLMLDTLESSGAKNHRNGYRRHLFSGFRRHHTDSIGAALKKALPEGIEVDFDESYKAMFCYKSKNYALLHADGRMSITGAALKSRGLEPFQRRYMETIIHSLLTHDQSDPRHARLFCKSDCKS